MAAKSSVARYWASYPQEIFRRREVPYWHSPGAEFFRKLAHIRREMRERRTFLTQPVQVWNAKKPANVVFLRLCRPKAWKSFLRVSGGEKAPQNQCC